MATGTSLALVRPPAPESPTAARIALAAHAEAQRLGKLAAQEMIDGLARMASEAAAVAELPSLSHGIREEARRLADEIAARTASMMAIMARGG